MFFSFSDAVRDETCDGNTTLSVLLADLSSHGEGKEGGSGEGIGRRRVGEGNQEDRRRKADRGGGQERDKPLGQRPWQSQELS